MALEGVFKKIKLDCKDMSDPSFELALILHNPQNVNEVFLLSLRDCLAGLPASHPVRRWYNRKAQNPDNPTLVPVREALQGPLKDAWESDRPLTPTQRQALMTMLDVLEEFPPYLDLTVLQAVGYQRLGNWARAETLMRRWLALSPLERLEKCPARRDALALFLRENLETYLEALTKGGKDRFILQAFFRGIMELVSDPKVTDKVEEVTELDQEDLVAKLQLRYHQLQAPEFSDWYLNRHLEGKRRDRFLDDFFARKESHQRTWIFFSRLPALPAQRELLARRLIEAKKVHDPIFYVLATDEGLRAPLMRVDPGAIRNFIKEKRQFFVTEWASSHHDMLALAELVQLGQIDQELVEALVQE